jgi:hypothetical protein
MVGAPDLGIGTVPHLLIKNIFSNALTRIWHPSPQKMKIHRIYDKLAARRAGRNGVNSVQCANGGPGGGHSEPPRERKFGRVNAKPEGRLLF